MMLKQRVCNFSFVIYACIATYQVKTLNSGQIGLWWDLGEVNRKDCSFSLQGAEILRKSLKLFSELFWIFFPSVNHEEATFLIACKEAKSIIHSSQQRELENKEGFTKSFLPDMFLFNSMTLRVETLRRQSAPNTLSSAQIDSAGPKNLTFSASTWGHCSGWC